MIFHSNLAIASCRVLIAVVSAAAVLSALQAEGAAGPRPNIVMVLVDDAGYADFPYYRDSHSRTPNIDQLCNEGLRFTRYYANAPICSPSRVALTTGQFPVRWGVTTFIAAREENARRGIRDWLDPQAPALPRMLQAAGYATGHFGKWHMGGGRDVGDAPAICQYGFDASLTQFEGLGDRVLPLLNAYDGKPAEKLSLGVASEKLGQGQIQWLHRDQVTKAFTARAVEFIQQAEAAGKPFYVNLWPDDVHTPLFPPQELRSDGGKRELYLGVLENMDRQLGELFDYIRNSETLSQNTIIIVASDNGFEPGAGSAGDLRGAKGALYEGGVRVPLVVWGPGVLEHGSAGKTNDKTVISSVDLVASLLELAGVAPPDSVQLDGEDLSRSLLGAEEQVRQRPLFWIRPPDRPNVQGERMPDLAMRNGPWKLCLEFDGSRPQLFNIESDPCENVNLARQKPRILRHMRAELLKWYNSLEVAPQQAKATARRAAEPLDSRVAPRRLPAPRS